MSAADPTSQPGARILVVDDEELIRTMLVRSLTRDGYDVTAVASAPEALRASEQTAFDLILTDISMPQMDGLDLLKALRAQGRDVPIVLLTGQPSVDTAAQALEHGAFRYLTKPIARPELLRVIQAGLEARARMRGAAAPGQPDLGASFQRALEGMWMAYQPILSVRSREAIGYEALMRSREPSLPHPGAVIDAAERLGAVHELGRVLRRKVAVDIETAPAHLTFFVNVHPTDLADDDLFEASVPLSLHAPRIVLELTERSTLEGVRDLAERIGRLRALGYRIAVDDLGAGYAGLSYFASIRPDLVKIDMSLVRDIDGNPLKQRVVHSLTSLGRSLGMEIVAEGIETCGERDVLIDLQCTHLQGYLFAKPAPPFVLPSWGE